MATLIDITKNNNLMELFKNKGALTYNELQPYFRETTYGQSAVYIGKEIIYNNMYDNHFSISNSKDKLNTNEMLSKLNEFLLNESLDAKEIFNKKLSGELPVTRVELINLVSSWGRTNHFETYKTNALNNSDFFEVDYSQPKECYDLSKLDVSQIEDLSFIFKNSLFNGDISKWDVSNTIKFSNTFINSKFDGDISEWKFNKDAKIIAMFIRNDDFINKYNNGIELPDNSDEFIKWFEENKNSMKEINIYGKYIDIKSDVFINSLIDEKIFILESNLTLLNKYFDDNSKLLQEQKTKYYLNESIDPSTKSKIFNQFEVKCREANSDLNESIEINQLELEKQKSLKSLDSTEIEFDIFKKI